jgi:hypothetical protein
MGNKHRNIQGKWWKKNWDKQWWIIGFVMLALLLIAWGIWASTFGVTVGVDRETEIKALIASADAWGKANSELRVLRQIMDVNSLSIQDPVQALTTAEKKVYDTTSAFEKAGFQALPGEMIIISGVMLQVLLTLAFITAMKAKFERRRQKESIVNNHLKWIEKFRTGEALDAEDEILKFIDHEMGNVPLSQAEIRRGEQVTTSYRRLMAKCRKATEAEIPWSQISSLFYKLALICKERGNQELESILTIQYKQLRRIIKNNLWENIYSSIGFPVLFLVMFTVISEVWVKLVDMQLAGQLEFWRNPVLLIGAAFVANGIVHILGDSFGRWFAERTWTDLDDVIIGAIVGPLSGLATATGPNNHPYEFGPFLAWVGHVATADTSRTLVVILVGTWFAVFLLNRVLVWFMEQWAKRTAQIYDDMFVKIVQVFGTFIILAFGLGAGLAVFNGPLTRTTGIDNIILPYTIIVSVFTAIVGYAASAGFENFFGGLLLQIEKPFREDCPARRPDLRCA